ncbi:hypothetical protein [Acinetobacter sp. Marseille-Q1618]|uniref:hypothetical protein n=1 Tax=Acinetobacter sp. Marseille-Q1618 TaxID=2697502 RepID=UPI00156F97DB|nr:hypothetical protein [Acinetobacter sp. Marseille-Q1618]
MLELSPLVVKALEELKDKEIVLASSNALRVRAWLYLMRFLSSFNYQYEKKNPHSSIELNQQQASLFAFGLDDNNPENFLFFAQEADFWWLDEICIEYMSFIDNYLIIKIPSFDYENKNVISEDKISVKSLTISIPLSAIYMEQLKAYIPHFKFVILGSVSKSYKGFKKIVINEYSQDKIPIKATTNVNTKEHYRSNSRNFLG